MSASSFHLASTILGSLALVALAVTVIAFLLAVLGQAGPARRTRFQWSAGATLFVVVCIAVQQTLLWGYFLPSVGKQMRESYDAKVEATSIVKVGTMAPKFEIQTSLGGFTLMSRRGRVVVLNFASTGCGACLKEMPYLQKLWEKYRIDDRVWMVVVGREETAQTLAEFQSQHGFDFPMAADPQRELFSRYATAYLPRTYIIGPNGDIRFASVGFSGPDSAQFQQFKNILEMEASQIHLMGGWQQRKEELERQQQQQPQSDD